ncbi:TRAP transporter substrate-binding protein DctP [Rhodovulum sp. DZ06]|uniref:TRAP transporter substrate-binding protein DctP n=1 Tax=Rhodovulum sp. DZ06 TaxID=3425126 RepID=UPI003D32DF7C
MRKGSARIDRRSALAAGAAAAAMLAAPGVLRAAPREMLINNWLPQQHLVPDLVLTEWSQMIERRTEGRVTFRFSETPMGPPPAAYGIIAENKADVTFALHGYSGDDAFKRSQVGQFSFLGDSYSATQAFSSVYWDLLDPQAEHQEIKLLSAFQHGPGFLFLKNRSIRGPEDFRGLRLRTSGGYISRLLQELGAETVPMPPFKAREAMEAGAIDGVAFPYEGGLSFGIVDQTTEVSELPGGYYNATWFLGMSPKAWDDLGRRDRRVVQQVSREFVPLLAAKSFDFVDHKGRTLFEERGVALTRAPDEVEQLIRTRGGAYEQSWIQEVAAQGYRGEWALKRMRQMTGVDRG